MNDQRQQNSPTVGVMETRPKERQYLVCTWAVVIKKIPYVYEIIQYNQTRIRGQKEFEHTVCLQLQLTV